MGHNIQAFIGKSDTIQKIAAPYTLERGTLEALPQGFSCLFLSDILYDTIHTQQADHTEITPFDFLDNAVMEYLKSLQIDEAYGYIETDYFGGWGYQTAGIIRNGEIAYAVKSNGSTRNGEDYPLCLLQEPINTTLRKLGIIRNPEQDEFDTLLLGNYRHMPYEEES